jgi:hypothetical protein
LHLIARKRELEKLLSPAKQKMLEQYRDFNSKDLANLQKLSKNDAKALEIVEMIEKNIPLTGHLPQIVYGVLSISSIKHTLKQDEQFKKISAVMGTALAISNQIKGIYSKLSEDQEKMLLEINSLSKDLGVIELHLKLKSDNVSFFQDATSKKLAEIRGKVTEHLIAFLKQTSKKWKDLLQKNMEKQGKEINNRLAHLALVNLCLEITEDKRMSFEQFDFYRQKIGNEAISWK